MEIKSQVKMILRRLNSNSASQASIESGPYTLQYAATSLSLALFLTLNLVGLRRS